MKFFLAISLLVLVSCSSHSDSPSATLKAYYEAIDKQDTSATYRLSTAQRVSYIRPHAAEYFKMCYDHPVKVALMSDTMLSDTKAIVRYATTDYDRGTGETKASSNIECVMLKENGAWKVSYCEPIGTQAAIQRFPRSNGLASVIQQAVSALNDRDSVRYWGQMAFETHVLLDAKRPAQAFWDSTRGSHVEVAVLDSTLFLKPVHNYSDTTLFAYAPLRMRMTGTRTRTDSMTAILRVDSGRWVLGAFSFLDPNRPFASR